MRIRLLIGWALAALMPLAAMAADYAPGEFLLGLREGARFESLDELNSRFKAKIAESMVEVGVYRVTIGEGSDVLATVEAYRKSDKVRFAEPNAILGAGAASVDRAPGMQAPHVPIEDFQAATLSPERFFDGLSRNAGSGLSVLRVANCTPGLDCPEAPKKKKPSCEEGLDCPDQPRHRPQPKPAPRQPACTPGLDCDGDRPQPTPGRGDGRDRAPAPPNYKPRPTQPPTHWPAPPSRVPFFDNPNDISMWHRYSGSLAETWAGDWYYGEWAWNPGSARISRGGLETGVSQGQRYNATLTAEQNRLKSRRLWRRYWRWVPVGNCYTDEWNNVSCDDWAIEYAWIYIGETESHTVTGQRRSVDVVVEFSNDKPLLKWDTETLYVKYDGQGQVWVESGSDAAFKYTYAERRVDEWAGRAYINLVPGDRILKAPEASKVNVQLLTENWQLKLRFRDYRASDYQNTRLELRVSVYKLDERDVAEFRKDHKKVFEHTFAYDIRGSRPEGHVESYAFDIPVGVVPPRSGKYFIGEWSFRRIASPISSQDWVSGPANKVPVAH
ncbi:MAG: hypothetical protein HY549_13310 [Elusimicrobia bacterium]|nr:hypothetical protein [Elusimicrobiota bacterium]